MSQAQLFPVSEHEFTRAAYDLALLLQQLEDEDANWDEAKKEHKETVAVLKKGITEKRMLIRRAQLEHEEGLAAAQVDMLMNEATERRE